MNPDFCDMLSALSAEGTKFLVVGSYAMAAHGYMRSTGDIDVWIEPSRENAEKVWRALAQFGAPVGDLTLKDLLSADTVFQIGREPRRIDLLTSIAGVEFDLAWSHRIETRIGEMPVFCLSREDLIANKRATGRPRDLSDVLWMEGDP